MKLSLADKLRCSRVKRWHLLDADQNLAEHQFNVAHIAISVVNLAAKFGCEISNIHTTQKNVAFLALHHDVPESLMGDLPTHIKKINNVRNITNEIESNFDPYVGDMPDYSEFEKWAVKVADFVDAYTYAQKRVKGSRYATNAATDIFVAAEKHISKLLGEPLAKPFLLTILAMASGENEHSILEGIITSNQKGITDG